MRYYSLTITNPKSGLSYQIDPNGLGFAFGTGPSFTSFYTKQSTSSGRLIGQTNPGALNIEFDLPVSAFHQPQGGAWIRIWGIGVKALGQASDLNGANFVLAAGMAQGLPLANPVQAGVLAQGQILNAFGNWEGTNQTIDLIVLGSTPPRPKYGISWDWRTGQPMAEAISSSLSQAFPGVPQSIAISRQLTAPANEPGWYESLASWADYLYQRGGALGAQIYGTAYPGVLMTPSKGGIKVWDGTQPSKTVALAFQDLIGQPTWIAPTSITFQTVLRADIELGDSVIFPTGIVTPYALTSPAGGAVPNAPAASKTIFQGTFRIKEVHHYANFRQPDAASWNTTFVAVPSSR